MLSIGDRVRIQREKLGMSQDELARKLGYQSRSSINKIESGERDLPQSKIKAIADALCVNPSFIMGWDETPPDPWSTKFRESLQEIILSTDRTDACDAGINLDEWSNIAYGSSPLSLETCCNICDEAGESLDEMTGLREKKTAESICGLDELSIRMAEIIHGLSPAAKEEAVHYLEYLESKSKM